MMVPKKGVMNNATQLLKKKENRDVFVTLKTPSGRLNRLRRVWEDRKN
jgi:hypothetical protein